MSEIIELTPGLQCCLRCGRVLTNRGLHDALEEPVLASIRAGRTGAEGSAETCQPCLEEYRNLLNGRESRSERLREEDNRSRLPWLSRWLGRRGVATTPSL
jgi:hypothetical protein